MLANNHLAVWPKSPNDLAPFTARFGPFHRAIWPLSLNDLGQIATALLFNELQEQFCLVRG